MALPNAKELKKLAKTCRDLGIKTFKSGEFEFTLSDELPQKPSKKAQAVTQAAPQGEIESDSLEGDALLFWSVGGEETEDRIGA